MPARLGLARYGLSTRRPAPPTSSYSMPHGRRVRHTLSDSASSIVFETVLHGSSRREIRRGVCKRRPARAMPGRPLLPSALSRGELAELQASPRSRSPRLGSASASSSLTSISISMPSALARCLTLEIRARAGVSSITYLSERVERFRLRIPACRGFGHLWPVAEHLRGLEPEVALIIGDRGSGKTKLVQAALDGDLRRAIVRRVPSLRMPRGAATWLRAYPSTVVTDPPGFRHFAGIHRNDREALQQLFFAYLVRALRQHLDAEAVSRLEPLLVSPAADPRTEARS